MDWIILTLSQYSSQVIASGEHGVISTDKQRPKESLQLGSRLRSDLSKMMTFPICSLPNIFSSYQKKKLSIKSIMMLESFGKFTCTFKFWQYAYKLVYIFSASQDPISTLSSPTNCRTKMDILFPWWQFMDQWLFIPNNPFEVF